MRRFVLGALALLGVAAAIGVTASSTMKQAELAGMTGLVFWVSVPISLSLVVVLEVVNVTGTWAWLTDTRGHVRWEAAAGVAFCSVVSGVCGVLSYGLIGLVAPIGSLFSVHLMSRMWSAPDRATTGQTTRQTTGTTAAPAVSPAEPNIAAALVDDGPPTALTLAPAPAGPARASDDDIVTALVAMDELPGREGLKELWVCGSTRADRLLAQARTARARADDDTTEVLAQQPS